ncbi:MAG: glyoxylate/hydroxypyruvate reductase A [Rhodobacteraceae bacterium]|nr:glyoxylate/hydroxypyruvate reductase A [Paracoccaceae bacterium]
MVAKILFAAHEKHYDEWRTVLASELAERRVDAEVVYGADGANDFSYIAYAPDGPLNDFSVFPRLKAVLSLWAGIEDLVANPTVTCPVTRMVETGMIQGMTEWVTAQTLRHHLGFDRIVNGQDGKWRHHLMPPLASGRTVAVLGLGELGRACANSLKALNFKVIGWSRTAKSIPGIECRDGPEGLIATVAEAEITILLLPHTPQTRNLVNAELLAKFRNCAIIINSGRGALIDDDALLDAIAKGRIAHATLDVFREEPLPATHRFWNCPQITVSPHIAADTRAETAAPVIAENVRRGECGEAFLYLVDKSRGY